MHIRKIFAKKVNPALFPLNPLYNRIRAEGQAETSPLSSHCFHPPFLPPVIEPPAAQLYRIREYPTQHKGDAKPEGIFSRLCSNPLCGRTFFHNTRRFCRRVCVYPKWSFSFRASWSTWEKFTFSSKALAFSQAGRVTVRLTDLLTCAIRIEGI